MNIVATRLDKIKPSPTLAASAKALALKAEGKNVIDLTIGEPDFKIPENIIESGCKALMQGRTKYTAVDGTASLKKAIIDKFKRENCLEYTLENINVGCGAKHVIYNSLIASVNDGDEIIIPAPYWVSYVDMALLAEGVPVVVQCDESNSFKLTAAQLEEAITPKTKWLFINSPSNPTGAVYTAAELTELAKVLLKHPDIYIMSDDIYEHLIYSDNSAFVNILNVEPSLACRTLVVNGGSKSFAMTGLRIGYGAGPACLIKNMAKIMSHSTSNPCSSSQYMLEYAVNSDISFLNEWKKSYKRRRDMACEILARSTRLTLSKPDGAFYIYVNCSKAIGLTAKDGSKITTDEDFSNYLLFNALVSVVFGGAFGLSPYFRLSYAISDDLLRQACERIVKAVDELE